MTTTRATILRASALAAASILGSVTAANADVISASQSPAYLKNVNVTAPALFASPIVIVPTATFQWTLDGAGDSALPATFDSFCLEANAPVAAGVSHEFTVTTLEGAGYSQGQRDSLAKLWTGYRDQAGSIDMSAAFQLAVWEIVHDDGLDVTSGPFTVNSWGDARDTAQSWLTAIATAPMPTDMPEFAVLQSGTVQDQILLVPAPGAAAMIIGGMGLLGAARRRR